MSLDHLPMPFVDILVRLHGEGRLTLVELVRTGADFATLQQGGHLEGLSLTDMNAMAMYLPPGDPEHPPGGGNAGGGDAPNYGHPPRLSRYTTNPTPGNEGMPQEFQDMDASQCTAVDNDGQRCPRLLYCACPSCRIMLCEPCWSSHRCPNLPLPERAADDLTVTKRSKGDVGNPTNTHFTPPPNPDRPRKVSPRPVREKEVRVETRYRTDRQKQDDDGFGPTRVPRAGEQDPKPPQKQRDQPRPEEFVADEIDKDRLGPQYMPHPDEKIVCLRGKHCRACVKDAEKGTKTCKALGPEDACPSCFKKGYCAVAVKVKNGIRIDQCSRAHVVRCMVADGQGGQKEVWRRVTQPEVPLPSTGLTSQEAFDLEDGRFVERKKVERHVEHIKGLRTMADAQMRAGVLVSQREKDDTPNDTVEKALDAMRFYSTRARMKGEAEDTRKELQETRQEARTRERKYDIDRKHTVDKLKSRQTD